MGRIIASPRTETEYGEAHDIAGRPTSNAALSFLAGVLQNIRAGFRRARDTLSSEIAPPLDVDDIAERLKIEKRAEEDGRRDLPPPGEEAPGGVQREIIAHFTNLRRRARQRAAAVVEKASNTLEQIRDSDDLAKLRDMPAATESRILRYLTGFESRLEQRLDRERHQQRHYEAFRKENKLDRVASYPQIALLYYLVVPMLIAAMAYVLTMLLAPGADGSDGLTVTWIAMVAAVAIIVPFVSGMLAMRSINHVNELRRLGGWLGVIATVAAILAIAFYADFHIGAAQADPPASDQDAIGTMLATPLEVISGIASWAIFGSFVLIGLLAMFLGYRSDDIYPGYGAVQRAYYRARTERENLAARLRKRINALVDRAEAEVAGITGGYKSRVRSYASMARQSARFPSVLSDYDAELEDACNIVLDRYRAANIAARDSGAPLSFGEHVCFNADDLEATAWQSEGGDEVEAVQGSVVELEEEATRTLQKLRDLNLRMITAVAETQSGDREPPA